MVKDPPRGTSFGEASASFVPGHFFGGPGGQGEASSNGGPCLTVAITQLRCHRKRAQRKPRPRGEAEPFPVGAGGAGGPAPRGRRVQGGRRGRRPGPPSSRCPALGELQAVSETPHGRRWGEPESPTAVIGAFKSPRSPSAHARSRSDTARGGGEGAQRRGTSCE